MLTSGQQRAVDLIAAGANVFLTGEGGTGKSFAIGTAVSRLIAMGKDVLLCAPTGVAAQNIGGSTIHSAFGFDFAPKVADAMDGLRPTKVISASDVIIIDEVGMVRRDLMDAIARVVKIENEARCDEKQAEHRLKNGLKTRPLQVVAVGDFSQLPPVATSRDLPALEAEYGTGASFHAFAASGWRELGFTSVMLSEVVRQKDPEFVHMLNLARIGDTSCLPYFNLLASRDDRAPEDATSLVGTNEKAASANLDQLTRIKGRSMTFRGHVTGQFAERDMAAPAELELKVGARVMCLANDRDAGYYNGATGSVKSLGEPDESGNRCILVSIDDGGEVLVKRKTWSNSRYVVEEIDGVKRLTQEVTGTFTQYPLKLSWAITFHKSQGQTLRRVVIDPSTFAPGQLYVGLSRATSPSSIWLTRPIKPKDLIADEDVVDFYLADGWERPEPATGCEKPSIAPAVDDREPQSATVDESGAREPSDAAGGAVAAVADLAPSDVLEELHRLLGQGGRAWVRVYQLIDRVKRENLFKPDFNSFSAWIKAEAARSGVSESLLWHRKSAGDFYSRWAERVADAPALELADKVSEENVELVRKISAMEPERGDALMRKLVTEGLSTKELRSEWRTVRGPSNPKPPAKTSDDQASAEVHGDTLTIAFGDEGSMAAAVKALEAAGFHLSKVR